MQAQRSELLSVGDVRVIRSLDSYEELIWLLGTGVPVLHTYVIMLDGATEVDIWRQAWKDLHSRYQILSAAIHKVPGDRPIFIATDRSSPMNVLAWDQSVNAEQVAADELDTPLDGDSGMLFRLTLFHADGRCLLSLTAHHAATDGKTSMLMLQDLLALVKDRQSAATNGDAVAWFSRSAFFGRPGPAAYVERTMKTLPQAAPDSEAASSNLPRVQVRHLSLSARETARLLDRAKAEGVSVHAILLVAFASAVLRYRSSATAIRCATPIDLRELAGVPEAVGLLITTHVSEISIGDGSSFWDSARQVGQEILIARSSEAVAQNMDAIDAMVETDKTFPEVLEDLQTGAFDLMVTNKAGYKFRMDYQHLRVTDIWSATASGAPPVQVISVITSNGMLGMTLASRQPIPSLLEDVRKALCNA